MMNKKLRIAHIAPLWIPVPPQTYGGIELMLSNLIEELVRREYDVTLFASGDSKTNAKLVPVTERAIWLDRGIHNVHAPIIRMIKMMADNFWDFDIIHNHFNFFAFPVSLRTDCPPMLTTVHRPVDEEYAKVMLAYKKIQYCALSQDQKISMEEQGIPVAGVVPNGIDMKRYPFNASHKDYLLYLGRLNEQKGIIQAIEVAKAAGKKLVIAGNLVGGDEWIYFMREVQPLLNDEMINFRGQVDFDEKIELLKNAQALLFPIDRREPFGLVMIEAMACGTPVIAFRKGSVPEVVEHGKTGFVVDTKEEMVEAIKHIDEIDRKACRKRVEENFTLNQMVDGYEELYGKLA